MLYMASHCESGEQALQFHSLSLKKASFHMSMELEHRA